MLLGSTSYTWWVVGLGFFATARGSSGSPRRTERVAASPAVLGRRRGLSLASAHGLLASHRRFARLSGPHPAGPYRPLRGVLESARNARPARGNALLADDSVLDAVAAQGERAAWVTSVCTGALVLGAAGLLRGYRATTHWLSMDLLAELGATPVEARVVRDRNRITGGGVTAGIDFALSVVAELRGQIAAERVALMLEYAPAPPFRAGTPAEA